MEAYPLQWPLGYERTTRRKSSNFKQTMDRAQRFLHDEIKRLKGTELIVSSNIPVRKDGGMYSMYMDRKIDDPGVAIYFKYKNKQISMCCDQYSTVWENIYALGKGIEALRGMERWGVSDFIDRAFTGFTALPEPEDKWWQHLNFQGPKSFTREELMAKYRHLSKNYHPDNQETGNAERFMQIKDAYEKALKTFN